MSLLRRVSQLYKRINYNNTNCVNEFLYKNIRCSFSSRPTKIKIKKKKSKLNENESEQQEEQQQQQQQQNDNRSNRSDWWRMKFYKFRRMSMILGIPFMISTGLYILHDSDIPYVYCLKKLRNYELPIEYDIDSPPNPAPTWCQTIPMIWAAQIHSHRPTRIMKQWNNFMPLLDSKYPIETRMVGIGCLMGMLSGDTNTLPPSVFFDKCLRKLEILKGYKSSLEDGEWTTSKFLNMIYGLCGETQNQQLLFAGLQLLLDLTSIPISHGTYDTDEAVKFIIDNCKDIPTMRDRDDLASSLMVIYQDPIYIIDFVHKNPPKQKQSSINPNFMEIKKILIDNDCLKFAFNLLDAKSIQLKQLAMFILIGLVGNYPNINEIKTNLGDTDDEKLQNGIKLVDSLAGIGQEHFQRGDNEAALGAFTEALKYLPRSAQLRYFAGKCLGELDRIEEAKLEYRKAMAITQRQSGGGGGGGGGGGIRSIPMPEATMQLCNLLIKHTHSIDDLEEATEYLQLLIGDGNGNGIYQIYQTVEHIEIDSIYDRLNICLEKLGRYDDALDKMLNLCKIKPNSHQIHFETGRMAIMCKEYDLAKEHLEFAVNLEPFDMFAKYYLSLSYFHLNNMEKSKKQILQILQSKPNDEKCLNLLAKIHIQQNNLNDALKIYKSLDQTKGKNNPYLQYQIGVVYENMNQNNESLQCFQNTANIWLNYVNKIGYEQYFYNRPKEIKALQKIQSRCEIHSHDKEWSNLNNIIQQIGLS